MATPGTPVPRLRSGFLGTDPEAQGRGMGRNPERAHGRGPWRESKGRLTSLVAAVKSKVASVARQTMRRPASRARPTSSTLPKSTTTSQVLTPIKRVSVVRKPPRGPTRRTNRPPSVPSVAPRERGQTASVGRVSPTTWAPPIPSSPASMSASTHGEGYGAPAQTTSPEARFAIPTGYGDDRIVLMVKDPWWLYAYWEIQPSTDRAARSQLLPHEVAGLQSILRVYDVTEVDFPSQPAHRSFDIGLSGLATNWYIHTNAPNRAFIVDLGILTNNGRFLLLARSNRVTTPRFGPSEVIDEEWMTTDEAFWALFGATTGVGMGSSQSGWSQAISQRLFSGGWSSQTLLGSKKPAALRGFWYRVNTDLVIHGATEPKATVMIQGQPVIVQKDGTFHLRLALPETTQTVTIQVTSPDGRQVHTTTSVVSLSSSPSSQQAGQQPRQSLTGPLGGSAGTV